MKPGQEVRYFADENAEKSEPALVLEIVGAGPSHYKILELATGKGEESTIHEKIKHERDAEKGEPFWMLPKEKSVRTFEEGEEPAPAVDITAFPDHPEERPAPSKEKVRAARGAGKGGSEKKR